MFPSRVLSAIDIETEASYPRGRLAEWLCMVFMVRPEAGEDGESWDSRTASLVQILGVHCTRPGAAFYTQSA